MKRALQFLGLAVLLGGIAWAATIVPVQVPQWFKAGIYIGATPSVATASTNRISTTVTADVDYDFANGTIVCTDSWAVTATGAKVGDTCFVGVGPRDGGAQIVTDNSLFFGFVSAADTVKVRHCPVGTAANPADAGYVVRCFSNQ